MPDRATLPDDLFTTGRSLVPRMGLLGGKLPIIVIDEVYQDPARVREAALQLEFNVPRSPYPGRIANIPASNPTIAAFLHHLLKLVNVRYLPRVRPMMVHSAKITAFKRVLTDFGIIDVHPSELGEHQRAPHVDAVAVFALLYLNEEERGGTMFFRREQPTRSPDERSGYFREGDPDFRLIGKIEGHYNRLAICPGFVPHTGEIAGEWIETEQRLMKPRLTQRFLFFP